MERPQSVRQKEKITKQQEKVMKQLSQIKDEVSGLNFFCLPYWLSLQHLCNAFKAAEVTTHFAAWRTLPSTSILMSDVLRASLECIATPVWHRLPNQAFSECEFPIVRYEVDKLLEKGVITKTSPMLGQILFSIFLCLTKDGEGDV